MGAALHRSRLYDRVADRNHFSARVPTLVYQMAQKILRTEENKRGWTFEVEFSIVAEFKYTAIS